MPTDTLIMKDSKIDWIGEIPENWDISRIKYDATFYNGDRSEEYPSGNDILDEGIPFINSENIHDTFLDVSSCKCITNEKYKRLGGAKLKINDIVFCLRGSVGNCSINKSINEGTVASSLVAIRANNINPDFLNYYLNSDSTVFQTSLFQNGSCAANLSAEKVSNYYICTPISKEQKAIADFLDEKCEKIDKVIGGIEEQIQVLKDYKKSLITETVTKGLDKNVPMKDSGIDWIGQIPQDWDIKRLKYIGNARNGLTYEPEDMVDEDGILVLRSSNIQDNKLSFDDNVYVKMLIPKQLIVKENDLLICSRNGSRNLIGKCALIDKNTVGNSYGAFMCVFRSEYNRFIRYVLLSDIFNYYLSNFLTATINQLTNMQLGNIKAPIPPIKVMKYIADYLDKECEKIDKTISDKKEQLETIKEYKKSLIYEYVTGKKRVAC